MTAYLAGIATGIAASWLWSQATRARRSKRWQSELMNRRRTTTPTSTTSNVNVVPSEPTHTADGLVEYLRVLPVAGDPGRAACPGCHGEGFVDGEAWMEICTACHGSGDAR